MEKFTAAEATAFANAATNTADELLATLRRSATANAKAGRRSIMHGGLDLYTAEVIAEVTAKLKADGFTVERVQQNIQVSWP